MITKYSPSFLEIFKKVDVRIRKSFKQKILIFSKNPNDLELNNHPLTKEWQGHNSIDITVDYRAIYQEKIVGEEVVAYFVALGTHEELYGKSKDRNQRKEAD